MAKGLRPRRSVRTALQHEIAMYAIGKHLHRCFRFEATLVCSFVGLTCNLRFWLAAQKEGMGLDKAVEDCKYRMSRYGVQPNMLVIPPQERF